MAHILKIVIDHNIRFNLRDSLDIIFLSKVIQTNHFQSITV